MEQTLVYSAKLVLLFIIYTKTGKRFIGHKLKTFASTDTGYDLRKCISYISASLKCFIFYDNIHACYTALQKYGVCFVIQTEIIVWFYWK